jgi:phage shock protein PspC (stress-responsive transcriptional regulator)
MSNKRSALKPSECENVADKSKKLRSSTRDLIRGKKNQCRGVTVGLTKTCGLDLKHIRVNAQNLIFFFIKCNLVILYYM